MSKEKEPDTIYTEGGVDVSDSSVQVGGDIVGRDKVVSGDEVRGDKVMGNKVSGDKITILSSKARPPDLETIAGYLKGVKKEIRSRLRFARRPARKPQLAGEALERLQNVRFYVRSPDHRLPRQELHDAIQKTFDEARQTCRLQCAVILAGAGVGKTTSLNYLLAKVAESSLDSYRATAGTNLPTDGANPPPDGAGLRPRPLTVPFFISLADLRAGTPLLALVRAAFNRHSSSEISQDEAHELLKAKAYTCLLLLDGLDELAHSLHSNNIQILRQFMDTYPHEQYVISCRDAGYHGQLGSADVLHLDRLTPEELEKVLGSDWYRELDAPMRDFLRNRSMLDIFLSSDRVHDKLWSKGQCLRYQVHRHLAGGNGESGSGLAPELVEIAVGLLEHMAYAMQRDRTYQYGERQMMDIIVAYLDEWHEKSYTWRGVLRNLKNTGLLKRDDERLQWSFQDRSIQAYLAASAINRNPALLNSILSEVADAWWYEVLEILVGMMDDPSNLLLELIDRDAMAAARCFQFARHSISSQVTEALIDALIEHLAVGESDTRQHVAMLLSQSDHSRAREALLQALRRVWRSSIVLAIVRALGESARAGVPLPLDEIETRLRSQDADLRPEAIIALWQAYQASSPEETELKANIESQLMSLMKSARQPPLVSGVAAMALAFIGTDTARRELLNKFVKKNQDTNLSWYVTEALTQIKHSEVEAVAIALYTSEKYQSDRWIAHRARAIYLLGWIGSQPATIDLLFQALDDPNPTIRSYAVKSIGRLEPQGARQQLEAMLESEQDVLVLRRIARTLGSIGILDSIYHLEQYLHSRKMQARQVVRQAIAEIKWRYQLA